MKINNNPYRMYGRTKGRSKKKINIKSYFETLNEYKINSNEIYNNNILDIGTGYGETTLFLSKKFKKKKLFLVTTI